MDGQTWHRREDKTLGGAALAALSSSFDQIALPPNDAAEVKQECDSFTFTTFTVDDAWYLGQRLFARLAPFASHGRPAVISISLANPGQVLFQTVTGPGTSPDNEVWIQRKRNSALRFGCSSWYLRCKFNNGDHEFFRAKNGMDREQASKYALHGGAVPIRVRGVEGIVAVVVVSGLTQQEDHMVIVETIREFWQQL